MKLQTQVPISKVNDQIDYQSRLFLLGSCFSENIGKKFDYFKFRSLENPFGILFHPKAIETLISRAINQEAYSEKEVFFHNERWHCFDAHSDLSNVSKNGLIEDLNNSLKATKEQINKSTHIIITLGTAWVYRKVEGNKIVSNCHKIAQPKFNKELLSTEQVISCLKSIEEKIHSLNKNLKLIYTISPVRHLKDGFVENQRSKAHLIAALHQIVNGGDISYFPSYEIMMDELRDYRFYESDMVHPNQLAIDYIWEKFMEGVISENAFATMKKVDEVQKGLMHRPFNPDSEQHRSFAKSLETKITSLKREHPFMRF